MSLICIVVSFEPMFLMIREQWIGTQIMNRYEITHAYEKDGLPRILDAQEIEVNDMYVEILEKDTGKDAPQTQLDKDENVPGGDIVTVQIRLNGEYITEPTNIWLSSRNRGSRYFSWLDVLSVRDKKSGENYIAIVQRLTDDKSRMDDREWRIINIKDDGTWSEVVLTYQKRSENPLGVRLVMVSGTSTMAMGYQTDILHGYPSLFFPLLYPWVTTAIGVILLVIGAVMVVKDKNLRKEGKDQK